jgi:hypothetical protein
VWRRNVVIVAMLGGSILSGCGQPLQLQNSVAQNIPTATTGIDQPAPDASIAVSPPPPFEEGSAPAPAESVPPAPAESAAPPPVTDPGVVVESPPAEQVVPEATPTVNPAFQGVQLPGTEERWRYVQVDRTVLDGMQTYNSPARTILWWYNPVFGREVKLGEIQGDFPVQATFRFRGQEVDALEVPYQINQSFGITLPPAIVDQIRAAGYEGEWIEAFVYQTSDIQPR